MRKVFKRLTAAALAAVLAVTGIPAAALAAETGQTESPEKLELKDDYISVTVSGENGGFRIDTLEGNKLNKSDNNKFLLYPAEDYDTSYTSFSVTRKDGAKEEYIFGRDYGFLGMDSSGVALSKQGNSLTATWSVKDLTVVQTLSLLDESAAQHGMVSVAYRVTTSKDDVADVKLRLMLDTALGYQDYGVYELPDAAGDYTHVRKETLLDNQDGSAFAGSLFAVDDPGAPKVTAYTVNTTKDGQMLKPYQVGFGHWNHLAATVFDFTPDITLDFTNPYNEAYGTADSAYALYYDLGALTANTASEISTYYGVFSNATVSDEEKVAINFLSLPGSMALNEKKDAYVSQVKDGRAGDISLKMSIENISSRAMDDMTVVVKTQNAVLPYEDWYQNKLFGEDETFTTVIEDYQTGETAQVEAFFQVSPLPSSEYRRFEVLCYEAGRGETLTEANLLGSREFYLYCPGTLGEKVAFTSIEPKMVYTEGRKNIYLSGQNFAMLKDTTSYVTYLHSLSGGRDVIVPAKNVVVDEEKNTMYLVVDSTLDAGSYQVVFDWNEAGKEDTTSPMLQFLATDKPEYLSPVYGIVTIEKEPGYSADNPRYRVMAYGDEDEYAKEMTDPNNQVLLEFRGNFSLWYDKDGNITEAKAVSLEDVQGKVSNTINISNCLDVESGSVSIVIGNPGTDDQVIETNIDGKVYTTNSRTKVWDGVCAISSIENGSVSTLLQYTSDADQTEDLENSVANTNAITLIWPGAASGVQTLAGIMLEFRYCQFGMMALEDGPVSDSTPKRRVIAFGAEMSPDFLVPSNYKWSERNTSTLEAVQLKIAKSNYTAEQLRDVQARYAQDQADWEEAERGSLALYVHDILFGGGFIGFNASVEVGLPSYSDGLPGVEGVLSLKIMPMDDWWEVGVAGSADFEVLQMEASLRLKSYNGIPVPDNLYFYLGGVTPGINVDGMGIFWIQGLGGGFDSLYDTLFSASAVPPLTLLLSGQFALFNMLQARADLALSMRGYDVSLSDVGFANVNLIDYMGMHTYWYPKLSLKASMAVNILGIIDGGGYLVLDENLKTGDLFWEGFVTASVKTPDIPLIGSITVGSADLGVNVAKIWGALHVLKLDMGVTYYWGGDVDFSFGKYDSPEPTYPVALMSDIPVYKDQKTGKVLYMSMGTNAALETEAKVNAAGSSRKAAVNRAARAASSIESSVDRMSHTISLGDYTGTSDKALSVLFAADSLEEARTLACSDGYKNKGIMLKDDTGAAYPLTWLDTERAAEEQEDANALLSYNEETKQASVTISFTEEESYAHTWTMATTAPADLALYDLKRLAGLESVTYSAPEGQPMTVNWTGKKLDEVEHLTVYAVDGEDEPYMLYETDDTAKIAGGRAGFAVPSTLPNGSYTLRVVASSETNSVNDILDAADPFTYTNPNQPEAPVIGGVALGGDYTLDAAVTKQADYDGYLATIYEQKTADGETVWTATDFAAQQIEADEEGRLPDTITVGGRYETTVLTDEEGNRVSQEEAGGRTDITSKTKVLGLEAGKTYCVGVRGYTLTEDGICQSEEVKSEPIVMRTPVPASVTVSAVGTKQLTDETVDLKAELDTVNSETVAIRIDSDQQVSGNWYLDGTEGGKWQVNGEEILRLGEEKGLEEGEHILELRGENAGGDAVHVQYRFRVDVTAPRLQIGAPSDGAFFGESVTVSGLSEPGAKIYILKDGAQEKMVSADTAGSFTADIPMDTSVLEQKLAVYAEDASGNRSIQYQMKLINELIGAQDVRFAIYMDGKDCTNQTLPAGAGGELELRAVSGEKSVKIPADSSIGRQVEWSVQAMEGTASLEGQKLTTDAQVNGLLLAELEGQSAGVVLGGNKPTSSNTYVISLPQDTIGYAAETRQQLVVADGDDFAFTVTVLEGYTATNAFVVKVNGVPLTGADGTYVISDIHAPKNITVEGVADVTPPEVEIAVSEKSWKDFLNKITFGIFFHETQDVTITAADGGSGVKKTEYYLSDTALTLEAVQALPADDWKAYGSTVSISPDRECVVYARSTDQAGNVTYVSSDGLILDGTAPVVTGMENDGVYYGDQTFQVEEKYLKEIQIDSETVEAQEGRITIPADNGPHTIVVTDQAGNSITYQITVYKIYTVQFVADDVVIGTKQVNHGSSVSADEFPEVPHKEGYDQTPPGWEPESLENVMADTVVRAVYTINTYGIKLPENPEGYEIRTEQGTTVEHGADFTFTVGFAEEYAAVEGFAVKANGATLTENEGVYTITDIGEAQTITVEGVADVVTPKVTIAVKDKKWKEFLRSISFGLFYKESQDVTITATDGGSGVDRIEYYLSDEALTLEAVQALPADDWKAYGSTFAINPDRKCVIYARSTDRAGNISYVSSDGMILDGTAPVIDGVKDGDVFYGDQTFRAEDDYLKEIRIDGNVAEASGGSITIPADNAEHIIEVTDQAGNRTVRHITVYEIYTVQFVADGAPVAARRVNYGSDVSANEFPEIPAKEGYDQTPPRWEPESLENVIADTVVQAVYTINTYGIALPENPEGYEIRTEQETTVEHGEDFSFTVVFAEEYAAGEGFAVKANGTALTGENGVYTITDICEAQTITVEGVADGVAPAAEIAVKENQWKNFLNNISFGLFYKESQDVTITATDGGIGVDRTEYYLSEAALTLEELKALPAEEWTVYEGTFSISPDRKCVIYARSTDRAGNAAYVSSDGMILDGTAPVIAGVEDGDVFYGDQTFRVEDDYLKEIRIDGEPAEASGGSITIPADNTEHTVEAVDQAGNSTVRQVTVYRIYKVEFVADGEIIDTKYVNYGSDLPAEEFPEVPTKQGYTDTPPKWDAAELKDVMDDAVIQAVYTPNRYTVTLPGSTEGYVIRPQQGTEVPYGESFRFTVEIAQGYQAGSRFHVYAGDQELTAVKGIYTISSIQGAVEIRVQGVEKTAGNMQPPADGQEFEKGNYYYKVISEKKRTVQVIAVKNTNQTAITVYGQVILCGKSYKVTSIAENAFKNYRKATSATIGRYVRVINKNAFAGCTGLKKVTINGNGLRQIRKNAFKDCKKLAQVVIKSKNLRRVEKYAFRNIRRNAVIKVPAARYKKYRKLFVGKGLPKKVKIKK